MYANGCISYGPIPLVLVRDRGLGPHVLPPLVPSTPHFLSLSLSFSLVLSFSFSVSCSFSPLSVTRGFHKSIRRRVCWRELLRREGVGEGKQNASIARKRELTRFPREPVPQFRRQSAHPARVTRAHRVPWFPPLILRRRSHWPAVRQKLKLTITFDEAAWPRRRRRNRDASLSTLKAFDDETRITRAVFDY